MNIRWQERLEREGSAKSRKLEHESESSQLEEEINKSEHSSLKEGSQDNISQHSDTENNPASPSTDVGTRGEHESDDEVLLAEEDIRSQGGEEEEVREGGGDKPSGGEDNDANVEEETKENEQLQERSSSSKEAENSDTKSPTSLESKKQERYKEENTDVCIENYMNQIL